MEDPEFVVKEVKEDIKCWGKEIWFANNEKYCGKLFLLKKGFQSSIHDHKEKDESFYILSGLVKMEMGKTKDKLQTVIMKPGDMVRFKPGIIHRFTGLKESRIIEASTTHHGSDTYRYSESGKVGINKKNL